MEKKNELAAPRTPLSEEQNRQVEEMCEFNLISKRDLVRWALRKLWEEHCEKTRPKIPY